MSGDKNNNTGSVWTTDQKQQTAPCETETSEPSADGGETIDECSVTVPVTINLPPDCARHVLSHQQCQPASGDAGEVRDLIVDQIEFELNYRINGEPIEEWVRTQQTD